MVLNGRFGDHFFVEPRLHIKVVHINFMRSSLFLIIRYFEVGMGLYTPNITFFTSNFAR